MRHDIGPGKLDSTYFLYTSDHGFHLGEMRLPYFKIQPYDTDIMVPLMIRGPGIRPGMQVHQIALNVDIAPTIASLFHTAPPPASLTDGKSLAPLLFPGGNHARASKGVWKGTPASSGSSGSNEEGKEASAAAEWRNDFVFEFWGGGPDPIKRVTHVAQGPYCHHIMAAPNNTYQGVRTADGQPITRHKSKWRNIWIRDVFLLHCIGF